MFKVRENLFFLNLMIFFGQNFFVSTLSRNSSIATQRSSDGFFSSNNPIDRQFPGMDASFLSKFIFTFFND